MESIEITHSLPVIHGGEDRIICRAKGGTFSSSVAYDMFHPPGPKLATLDKPWLHHLGTSCVLCSAATLESHDHLFFLCPFASSCLCEVQRLVRFHWPYRNWVTSVHWAARRWRGKHVVNASFRALLASLVYHVWQERNARIFRQTTRTPLDVARIVVTEIRDLIISKELPQTVSSRGMLRWVLDAFIRSIRAIRSIKSSKELCLSSDRSRWTVFKKSLANLTFSARSPLTFLCARKTGLSDFSFRVIAYLGVPTVCCCHTLVTKSRNPVCLAR
ncbi:UNVERIFIED_CONTAM: hypothetical protein Slati_2466200 [Sesamum latifolium]|uniref:Reverse transcriptase zinc-binding domain-containing protein n=1 Tax=Sesamum latifolium TaxID=2727402 RepID=A0AAW2WHE5_9LAMI